MKTSNIRDYKRDKDIFKLRQKGLTFGSIGAKYKICANRVRQLYLREEDRINHFKK
jgi:hypothetical protein